MKPRAAGRPSLAAACCALLLCSGDARATIDVPTTTFTLLGFDAATGHVVVRYDYFGGGDDRQTRELRLVHRETGKVVHKAVLFNTDGSSRARPSRKARRAFLAKIKLDKGQVLKLHGKRAKGGELGAGRYWYRGMLKGGGATIEVVLKGRIPVLPEEPEWGKTGRHVAKIRRMVTVTRGEAKLLLQDRTIKLTPGATMNDGGAWGFIGGALIGGRVSSDGRTYVLLFQTPDPSDFGGPASNDEPVVIAVEHEAAHANALGMRLLKRRKVKRATAAFERAFALHPANKHAAYNLACMRARAKDAAAAIKLLQALHKHHPKGLAGQLTRDKDFNTIRDDPRFAAFIKTLR